MWFASVKDIASASWGISCFYFCREAKTTNKQFYFAMHYAWSSKMFIKSSGYRRIVPSTRKRWLPITYRFTRRTLKKTHWQFFFSLFNLSWRVCFPVQFTSNLTDLLFPVCTGQAVEEKENYQTRYADWFWFSVCIRRYAVLVSSENLTNVTNSF